MLLLAYITDFCYLINLVLIVKTKFCLLIERHTNDVAAQRIYQFQ